MKNSILIVASLAALSIGAAPGYAQHGGRPATTPGSTAMGGHGSSASGERGPASSNTTGSPSLPGTVLSRNPKLEPALTNALGKSGITLPSGMTLSQVCNGFKNLGQCIAALHINHKFPGCSLTALSGAKNLGQGIQGCNPQADAKSEARNASNQANQEIKDAKSNS